MKTKNQQLFNQIYPFTALTAAAFVLSAASVQAVNYAGNGDSSFGGDIGNGVLSLTDDGTNINGSLTCGQGDNMYNTLVIYIDTGAGGGFTTTTNFNDQNDTLRIGISGVQGSNRSVLAFTNGFVPQYAIALGPNTASFGGLWQLANGGNNSLNYVTSANLNPSSGSAGPFTFSIPATAIGLTNGIPATIKIFGTYISNSGYRSAEAIAGNLTGAFGAGWNPFTQTAFATYNFSAGATPTYPVTFQVDMTAQIASGAFNPANGDTVYAAGSFQTNPWTGFALTPTGGNTNIYTGVYQDANPLATAEQYKFKFHSVANNADVFEGSDNRPFTLQAGGQILSLVYFDDLSAIPSATTNALTFSIDMGPQIGLGHFNPANGDLIEVLGTLTNPKWTAGVFVLTNDLNGANTNLYSGTYSDGNYPGSYEQYKFVIVSGGNSTYESINNRTFNTPTNSYVFPLAYFNNISSIYAIPVTFQVDMTTAPNFNPGSGDFVTAAGTFQTNQWTAGVFVLTNNPSGTNANLYSGTYIDQNAPGTAEQFKFQINSGGNATWESINNRQFLLAASAQTLPAVYWNNADINNVLKTSTQITFTVNMNGAVDVSGAPFDPANDLVMVNGDFTQPTPWIVNWTDILISSDYPQYFLQENPVGSGLYTGTFTVPVGNSLQIIYKYGIFHNSSGLNTNTDNEAAANLNHSRYIRTVGAYRFPVDIFGIQRTNQPAANEISFGNLTVGAPVGGLIPVNWLGRPGVHLQGTTNLSSGTWQDYMSTDGASSTNLPVAAPAAFFRLINP